MSSLPSYGRRAAGGAARLGSGHVSDDAEYVSESPSQASERSIENRDPATMRPQPEPSNGWRGAGRYAYPAPGYGGSDGDEFSAEERFEPYRAHQHRTDAFGTRPSAQDGWYSGYAEPEPRARWPPPLAVSAPAIHKPQPVAPHTFFERDGAAPAHGWGYDQAADAYEASDDNASIHSGESLHEAPAEWPSAPYANGHGAPAHYGGGGAPAPRPVYYDLQLAAGEPGYDMYYEQ
ncbi:hypothetical protein IWQ57_001941 [Coemansia nantahalensis]|uniref:Uncharacterized protein n=1 Tax=Coemansia nantahalensis TaxID=2789366 RepID=A0ACC1K2D5_9FUNG|nr:hypothetical protein IWQ57_001941 [Coemansia nantahalensis]